MRFFLVKSHICMAQQLENACKEFSLELRIPCTILVHELRGIEVCIVNLRNGIQISIEGESWTRLVCGNFAPKHALYHVDFPNF